MVEKSIFTIIYNNPFTLSLFDLRILNQEPYNIKDLTNGIANTVNNMGKLLKRTYGVRTSVEIPKENMVLTKIKPVTGKLEKREIDLDIERAGYKTKRYFDNVCRRLTSKNKDLIVIPRDYGFCIVQILGENFNPEATKFSIEATENLMLYSFNQKHKVTKSEINPDYLEHNIEILEPPKDLYS